MIPKTKPPMATPRLSARPSLAFFSPMAPQIIAGIEVSMQKLIPRIPNTNAATPAPLRGAATEVAYDIAGVVYP